MNIRLTLESLKEILPDAQVSGAEQATLTGIASLEEAGPEELSFLGNSKYRSKAPASRAGAILLPLDYEGEPQPGQAYLRVKDPSSALAAVCSKIEAMLSPPPEPGVHSTAWAHPEAVIDATASIGPNCSIEAGARVGARSLVEAGVCIGANARIGDDCVIKSNAAIGERCELGDRVRLHSGVVIGSDGFGYVQEAGRHVKVPQIGIVVIESDVEIGANTTIDRARFGETRIGEGTKIDNLVQIGHNVRIGKHCVLVSQSGVSGSSILEDYVVLWGQVGVIGHVTLGKGSFVGAQGGVNCSLPPGSKVTGSPVMPLMQRRRADSLVKRLPELYQRIQALEEQLNADD